MPELTAIFTSSNARFSPPSPQTWDLRLGGAVLQGSLTHRPGRFTRRYDSCGNGVPPASRIWLAHAFIAKSVHEFLTIGVLIGTPKFRRLLHQLCGGISPERCLANPPSAARCLRGCVEGGQAHRRRLAALKSVLQTDTLGEARGCGSNNRCWPSEAATFMTSPRNLRCGALIHGGFARAPQSNS